MGYIELRWRVTKMGFIIVELRLRMTYDASFVDMVHDSDSFPLFKKKNN